MLFFRLSQRRPAMIRRYLMDLAAKELGSGYDMRHFSPDYKPWDQRLCAVPDSDLFTSLRNGKARVVTDTIANITAHGITLASGQTLDADVIVKATGLELEIFGGMRIRVDGKPVDVAQAVAYKGMMLSGVPNLFMAFGYTNASWTLKADLTAGWVCRALNHLHTQGQRSIVAKWTGASQTTPFMALQSGYVARAQHLMPRQGMHSPWRVHQNYLADVLAIRFGRLDDGVLEFH